MGDIAMNSAVLFSGPQALDFSDVRANIIRIPEVKARLDEAQKIWDENVETVVDLHQFICSEDQHFFNNLSLKSLCSAVIQVGLYDRLKKLGREPQFLIGDCRNDSALKVVAGLMTLSDLVLASRAAGLVQPLSALRPLSIVPSSGLPSDGLPASGVPVLNGQSFALYEVLEKKVSNGVAYYSSTRMQDMDASRLVENLYLKNDLRSLISVGPGRAKLNLNSDSAAAEIQISESIDLDPLLSWFWRAIAS